jgi:hypothetical protein
MHFGIRGLLITLGLWSTSVASLYAGRPLVIDDVAPVSVGQIEFEWGFLHARPSGGGRVQNAPIIGVTYGAMERLEMGLAIQRVNHDERGAAPVRGFEDLHFNAKYKFFDEAPLLPAFAAAVDLKLPTANRSKGLSTGKTDETALLIASKSFAPFALHSSFGYTVVGRVSDAHLRNRWRGGSAAEWTLDNRWSLVGEVFGASRAEQGGKNEADFQIGARLALQPSLVLDFAAGRSLRVSGNAFQATFGFTWTIDPRKLLSR